MSDCRWSKRCLGQNAALALVSMQKTPGGKLDAIETMLKFGTVCRRHGMELLEAPAAESAQIELKGA